MQPKPSVLILGGVVSVATIAGGTYALMQPKAPQPQASSVLATPMADATPSSPLGTPSPANASSPAPVTSVVPNPSPTSSLETKQPALRDVQSCEISMALVQDPDPPLNVRSAPIADGSEVVDKLDNGTMVTVVKEQDGWFQISDPTNGWIAKTRTESGCNRKVERVQFGTGETSIKLRDRFIGTGSHQYRVRAAQGQTLTLQSGNGPLPILLDPDGKTLNQGMDDRHNRWSGELPKTGDYTIEYDSNFRGYQYELLLEIR